VIGHNLLDQLFGGFVADPEFAPVQAVFEDNLVRVPDPPRRELAELPLSALKFLRTA
jgi:hypothetical protein